MERNDMSVKEIDRMADWLKAHGHTAEEVTECIKYIANNSPDTQRTK